MPTFRLAIDDGMGWAETIGRFPDRQRCYREASSNGPGSYRILRDDLSEPLDRELRIEPDGSGSYRIPGSLNWHPFGE